jgi:hypothetical protein
LSLSRNPLYQMRKREENDVRSGTLDDCLCRFISKK